MAKVLQKDNEVILQLTFFERLGAIHGSPRVPQNSILKIDFVDDLWSTQILRGVRAPGTALPYIVLLGTLRGRRFKDFVAIKGRGQGCVVTLSSGPFERWIFTLEQPQSELSGLVTASR